jgi:3-oxoacyl-[acyl-carrier protein] reductase
VAAQVADVTKPDQAAKLVEAAVAAFGGVDNLINNVGGGQGGTRIADSTDDDWRAVLEMNLVQALRMMRLALLHMSGRPGAAVINVASISGWSAQLAMAGQYGAAKAALIYATERWALEFMPHGIRVNTVSPGWILVEGNGWDRYRIANPDNFHDYVRHGFPMGRLGTPEEVADVVVFIASSRAHWINGRNLAVDGLEQPTRLSVVGRFRARLPTLTEFPYTWSHVFTSAHQPRKIREGYRPATGEAWQKRWLRHPYIRFRPVASSIA